MGLAPEKIRVYTVCDEVGWIIAENLLVDEGVVTKLYPDLNKIVMGL
jgi:hypothetical protein